MALSHERYSAIGHTGMAFWNPVGEAVLDEWIDALPLAVSSRVLDVGCGRAELLLRILARHRCSGVGVDSSPLAIDAARKAVEQRLPGADCDLRCAAFDPAEFSPQRFDLACCVGSSHALGGYGGALEALAALVKPGGLILVGEGYWRREPEQGYLDFLQSTREELLDHPGNIAAGREQRLEMVRACETSDTDWAHYEDGYAANLYTHLESHPDDPDADAICERIDAWRAAYLRWGRETLGFGLYLFRTPG